ncbi:MAG: hypothetical protein K8S27_01815 [Candidatus Omnitrophica bacterium]|nr:hypothetical protein [Candidatus Omnitrophota bacterium]
MPKKIDIHTQLEQKYTFRIGGHKIILFKKHLERVVHVYSKALVLALFHRQYSNLLVEHSIEDRYKPDVVALDDQARPLFWAECLAVKPEKINKLLNKYRKTYFVFIRSVATLDSFTRIIAKIKKKSKHQATVEVIALPDDFDDYIADDGHIQIRKRDCDYNVVA